MNPVGVADLEARWRPLTSQQQITAQACLDDAWAILNTRLTTLQQRLTDGDILRGTVVAVVCAMALRVLRNPDGKVSETIDDYTYRRSDAVSDGRLYVADDELALLGPNQGAGGAFTIRPAGTPGFRTSPFLDWS